jgi:hypothetical protein
MIPWRAHFADLYREPIAPPDGMEFLKANQWRAYPVIRGDVPLLKTGRRESPGLLD